MLLFSFSNTVTLSSHSLSFVFIRWARSSWIAWLCGLFDLPPPQRLITNSGFLTLQQLIQNDKPMFESPFPFYFSLLSARLLMMLMTSIINVDCFVLSRSGTTSTGTSDEPKLVVNVVAVSRQTIVEIPSPPVSWTTRRQAGKHPMTSKS